MENREAMRKYKKQAFQSMKDKYDKVIEVNNEPKLTFDDQQDDLKHL